MIFLIDKGPLSTTVIKPRPVDLPGTRPNPNETWFFFLNVGFETH
jgi:hypothetical protein